MKRLVVILSFLFLTPHVFAQSSTIFKGQPVLKVSEGGSERVAEEVPKDKVPNLACVISEIEGKHYWASRENVELVAMESSAFTTFVATNGSGYIRVINPKMKQTAALAGGPESKFDYVEHLLIGLRSVTYYGIRSK